MGAEAQRCPVGPETADLPREEQSGKQIKRWEAGASSSAKSGLAMLGGLQVLWASIPTLGRLWLATRLRRVPEGAKGRLSVDDLLVVRT